MIPRGIGALGYTLQRPTEDRYLMTRAELLDRIAILLGEGSQRKLSLTKYQQAHRMIWKKPPKLPR